MGSNFLSESSDWTLLDIEGPALNLATPSGARHFHMASLNSMFSFKGLQFLVIDCIELVAQVAAIEGDGFQ